MFASGPPEAALATSVGAEIGYFAAPDSSVGGATASFQLLTARPRFCGPFARPSRTFGFAPCASAEIGVLLASGADIPFPEKERRLWAAGVLSFVSQALLSDSWLVELELGANLPLTRDRFVFVEPESSIHEVSGLGFAGGLKIGSRL
jgi:hypothetical protein